MENLNTTPTAESFFFSRGAEIMDVPEAMIEFAKLHVEEFRKELLESVETTFDSANNVIVDEDSILNAYPPENIK